MNKVKKLITGTAKLAFPESVDPCSLHLHDKIPYMAYIKSATFVYEIDPVRYHKELEKVEDELKGGAE